MKIQTFSIVVGTEACNASCPFCISKQTTDAGVPETGLTLQERERVDRNFLKACRLAQLCGCVTILFTGKGEPTLFPKEISGYLDLMQKYDFPRIELQTNGIRIWDDYLARQRNWEDAKTPLPYLQEWYDKGMTTIALSMVHWDDAVNGAIYAPGREKYAGGGLDPAKRYFPSIPALTRMLHDMGFFVRWSATMLDGYVHDVESVMELVNAARRNKVEQLTLRLAFATESTRDAKVNEWVKEHACKREDFVGLMEWFRSQTKLMTLSHGAAVYDVGSQNVCLTDCMTACPEGDDIRTLIFFPNGQTRYDWRYEGATL